MKTLTPIVLMLMVGWPLFCEVSSNSDIPVLAPGKSIQDSLTVLREGTSLSDDAETYKSYRFTVTDEMLAVRISLKDAPADLDLFVKKGTEIFNYQDVDFALDNDSFDEELLLSRFGKKPLASGDYYIDVAYQRRELPVSSDVLLDTISYTLTLSAVRAGESETLAAGEAKRSYLSPETAMAKSFSVNVPSGADYLGIAVFGSQSDLDFFVARDASGVVSYVTREISLYRAETVSGTEHIVIGRESSFPLSAGRYIITVVDQTQEEERVDFSIVAYLSKEPPQSLRSGKVPSVPSSDFDRAAASTVQVLGENVKGSGCIVSETGYLITAYHVVKNNAGKPSKRIVIAATTAQDLPPEELFLASVISYDEKLDLALLRISSDVFGFPLPAGSRFPFFTLGRSEELSIGEPVFCVGYPVAGAYGPRPSVSLTRGIVSGFEKRGGVTYVKSDVLVDKENSGGALMNAYAELLGFPLFTASGGGGRMSFFVPVSALPQSWLRHFQQR